MVGKMKNEKMKNEAPKRVIFKLNCLLKMLNMNCTFLKINNNTIMIAFLTKCLKVKFKKNWWENN